jgi:hypothetical protein
LCSLFFVVCTLVRMDLKQVVNFKMVRADMRSVMALKDLYLSLGEIHTVHVYTYTYASDACKLT